MPAKVTLTVKMGQLDRDQCVFNDRTTCIIGREDDCDPRVPSTEEYQYISRLHCMMDINPPDIRVRDFGSLHGTYVNGKKIGQRASEDQRGQAIFPEHDLKDGDEVRLGDPKIGTVVAFQVGILVPVSCAECGTEIPEDRKSQALKAAGVYQCSPCRQKVGATQHREPLKLKAKVCAKCGRDVSQEVGPNRQGDFVCARCKKDPEQIMRRLLELAQSGAKDLLAIRGYKIQRPLCKGGQGAIYLARHEKTGEEVAIKVLLPEVAADERGKALFLREVEFTKTLKHRHVVKMRDWGCSQGTFFFTLEYCHGGSVDQLMKELGGVLDIAEAGNITLQVLAGLDYAHQAELSVKLADGTTAVAHGLVHRDLKPQNIFLCGSASSLVAKVGDFGLARAFDTAGLSGMTRTGTTAGTPYFMPRQQVVNFKYAKPDVDVWAVAASLYFMLTGQVPRDFPEGKEPWQVVLDTLPVPIRERDPNIPTDLAQVIDDALVDKQVPGGKTVLPYKTADAFKRALERVLP